MRMQPRTNDKEQSVKTNRKTNGRVEILIAEDSPTQAAQLAHLLERHGYSVTTAANGREALASLERRRPTLVISDIVMPELDGYGLCRAVKADKKLKDIPVMLVTTLSDPQDVIRGLECGADNFLRKPYDERHLVSRIDYLLMNLELRKNQKMQMGMEIDLGGQKHFISSERQQILDLLISTYEEAVEINSELKQREKELAHSNKVLNGLYRIADGLNHAASERQVMDMALERALELPGIQAGWISLREGESSFRLAGARNLPPALESDGAMEGDCTCRRRLISGELDHVTNIMECQRLSKATGDTRGLRFHASVPLWIGDRTLGVMNLVGPEKGLFNEDELKILYSVGNQVAVALERAHLHENLETVVQERTAELEAEILERKRIGKEQARLVAIIEATPDLVATGDPNGHVLYLNRAGVRMLGLEPGLDLSTVRFLDTHPDWAAKLMSETGIPHAIEHGTWNGETAYRGRDGLEIPISQVIIAHKGPHGSVEYLSTIARDITLQKEHEKRITRLNRVYAVLSGINATIVRTQDRQELFDEACRIAVELGKFRLAWVGLVDANGVDVTPVARAGVDEGYLDNIQLTARDDAPGRCEMLAGALREKTTVVCNDIDTGPTMARWREEALRRGYRSVVVFPLQFADKVFGILALYAPEKDFFDTEEMKLLTELAGDVSFALDRAELAKYTESLETRLERVLESVPDVLFSMSADLSEMSYASPAATRVFGFTPQEFMADAGLWARLVEPNDVALVQTALDRARCGESVTVQFRMKHRDGTPRWLDATVVPVRNAQGEVECLDGIARDVTEARQLEDQLRAVARDVMAKKEAELTLSRALDESRRANAELDQASRFKDEFLANMSHELRTPLNAILGLSETLLEQLADTVTPRQVMSLTTISTSGQHLLALINDILDLSKVEAGMLELNLDTVDLQGFCESCLAFVRTQALHKYIGVACEYDARVATLSADPKRLKQILVNLLTNAVKFTPVGGRIGLTVAAPEDEDVVRFTVWDTGIGIAPADAAKLFRTFTQLDSGLSRDQEGTGLGLALVAKLVELHGGSVVLESEPGHGTRFIVTLPLVTVLAPVLVPAPHDETDRRSYRRVLIIEDDPTSGAMFVKYLTEQGLSSVVHTRGEEAVDVALHERPDVIVLDIQLPGESGWMVLMKLKEHHATRDIPVVVISVVDEPQKSRALGAVAHFTKPVTRAQFADFFQRPAVAPPHRAARLTPAPSAVGPLVLLAEDNAANVQTIGGYLEDKGYAMLYAMNGLVAVQLARERHPALILMDIQMPVMDGLTAIREIRADASMQDLPIIALTALAMAGDRERCLAAGATEYLSKPVNLKGLAALVSRLVSQTGVAVIR